MTKTQEIIRKLGLEKHPLEGGFFKRSYTCQEESFFKQVGENRPLASAIYYLFDDELVSRPHYLKQDEIWHFYSGQALEILLIYPDNSSRFIIMGADILNGQVPQVAIPASTIFCAKMKAGGTYSLIGATLSPAFSYKDYHEVNPGVLLEKFPEYEEFLHNFIPDNEVKDEYSF